MLGLAPSHPRRNNSENFSDKVGHKKCPSLRETDSDGLTVSRYHISQFPRMCSGPWLWRTAII